MRSISQVLACLACTGYGHGAQWVSSRVQDDPYEEQHHARFGVESKRKQPRPNRLTALLSSSKALVMLLLGFNPTVSRNAISMRHGCNSCASLCSTVWMRQAVRPARGIAVEDPSLEWFSERTQVTLHDSERGNAMQCICLGSTKVEGKVYASMVPLDTPVSIYDVAEGKIIELDEKSFDDVFTSAQEACLEIGLRLISTPETLTVMGEIMADANEDEDVGDHGEDDSDEQGEELAEVLLEFTHRENQFFVLKMLDPFFICGRQIGNCSFEILKEHELKQLAMRGECLLESTDREEDGKVLYKMHDQISASDALQHAFNLRDRGFTVLPYAGLDGIVPAARLACERELDRLLKDVSSLGIDPIEQTYAFREVIHRSRKRWEMRMDSVAVDKLCVDAVAQLEQIIYMLHRLPVHPGEGGDQQMFPRILSPTKPNIVTTGVIVARPGASEQRFHPDASEQHFRISASMPSHRLFTVFVPLIDIAADGSGTQFWPGSHLGCSGMEMQLEASERSASGEIEDDAEAMAMMEAPACPAGGIIVFDARITHRGLPNCGNVSRPYAYAICGTGWAKDVRNLPEDSLQAAMDSLPGEPDKRQRAIRSFSEAQPFWHEAAASAVAER